MAKTTRKPKEKAPDKFHVGQRVILRDDYSAAWTERPHVAALWQRANGQRGIVVGPRQMGAVVVRDADGTPTGETYDELRYPVRWGARKAATWFHESQLRPIAGDGSESSTWDEFQKATGINLVETIVVEPVKKARRREGADHG